MAQGVDTTQEGQLFGSFPSAKGRTIFKSAIQLQGMPKNARHHQVQSHALSRSIWHLGHVSSDKNNEL
jgi:hypothetical protein